MNCIEGAGIHVRCAKLRRGLVSFCNTQSHETHTCDIMPVARRSRTRKRPFLKAEPDRARTLCVLCAYCTWVEGLEVSCCQMSPALDSCLVASVPRRKNGMYHRTDEIHNEDQLGMRNEQKNLPPLLEMCPRMFPCAPAVRFGRAELFTALQKFFLEMYAYSLLRLSCCWCQCICVASHSMRMTAMLLSLNDDG